jgi:hypothetical protein
MKPFLKELFDASVALEGNEWNAEALSAIPACKGILLFADLALQPIQLLQSSNLRRTAQARLQREPASHQARKTDLSRCTRHIFFTCGYNDFLTYLQLLKTAHALGPEAFSDVIRLPETSFAILDLKAPWPYFSVSSSSVGTENRYAWGLFPSRKATHEFCQSLNIAFCLCRNPSLLQTGKESSCPYFQMLHCPGPCLGKISRHTYMEWVTDAVTAANGGIDESTVKLSAAMQQAAADRRFEIAQSYKERIELLRRLKNGSYKWTENLRNFCLLHIDRGPKIQVENQRRKQPHWMAWKITGSQICQIGQFTLSESQSWSRSFERDWENPTPSGLQLPPQEHLGLLSLLLYRSRPQGLWFNTSRKRPDPIDVFESITALITQKKEDTEPDSTSSDKM